MKTGLWRSDFRVWGVCDRRGKSKWGTNYVDFLVGEKKNKQKMSRIELVAFLKPS
jgi:hypothetical protein